MNHGSFHAKAPTCADYMPLTINSVTSETLVKETFRPVCEGPAMQELQFNCLKCGQRIACDARGAGIEISCPTCQAAVIVPPDTRTSRGEPSRASTPLVVQAYGIIIQCLYYLVMGLLALAGLKALSEGNYLGLVFLTPAVGVACLGVRLGLGVQKGEKIAVVGAMILAVLGAAINWGMPDLVSDKPPSTQVKILCALWPLVLYSPLCISAIRNWRRLS